MTGQRAVTGVLLVDLGEGREIRHGNRAGQIQYTRQPRARFECGLCGAHEGPVTGVPNVRAFVDTIRARHQTTCQPNYQGAQAA